jgi:hypothetical protein
MITGWGSHHIDCAHWAMNMEHSASRSVGTCRFSEKWFVGCSRDIQNRGYVCQRSKNGGNE